jgi:hypothetical protein
MTAALAATVPPFDPFGLPAPAWVFEFLMILTMLLHLLFMNFTLGGVVLAGALDGLTLLKRGNHNLTVRVIWQMLPVTLSFTITTGVAPLLFVQVMFGQFFYPANVFMGFTWFAVVPLLIAAFYIVYFVAYRLGNLLSDRLGRWDRAPGKRLIVSLVCMLLFAAVAWILTNNHMLSIQPDQWARDGQWRQNRFQVTPLTTHPRFGHNFAGALAVAGLCVAAVGWWRRWRQTDPPQLTEMMIKTGLWAFLPMAIVAMLFGVVFLFLTPQAVWQRMLSPTLYTVLWWIGLALAIGQILCAMLVLQQPTRFRPFAFLAGMAVITLVGMLAGREQLRLAYLARDGAFSVQTWYDNVHPQVSSLMLFAVMLVVALATVVWLLRTAVKANPPPGDRAA